MQLWTDQIFGSCVAGLNNRAPEAGVFTRSGLMPTAITRLQDPARAVGDYREGVCQLPSALCALRLRFPGIAKSVFSRDLLDKITLPEYSGPCPYGCKRSRACDFDSVRSPVPKAVACASARSSAHLNGPPACIFGYTIAHAKARNFDESVGHDKTEAPIPGSADPKINPPSDPPKFGILLPGAASCKLLNEVVGASGFEPPTSWSRTRRS